MEWCKELYFGKQEGESWKKTCLQHEQNLPLRREVCTVEPLTNDHPHQRPSLSYDHISCDGQWFLFVYESLTSDHPSYTTTPMWFWGWSYKRGSTVLECSWIRKQCSCPRGGATCTGLQHFICEGFSTGHYLVWRVRVKDSKLLSQGKFRVRVSLGL